MGETVVFGSLSSEDEKEEPNEKFPSIEEEFSSPLGKTQACCTDGSYTAPTDLSRFGVAGGNVSYKYVPAGLSKEDNESSSCKGTETGGWDTTDTTDRPDSQVCSLHSAFKADTWSAGATLFCFLHGLAHTLDHTISIVLIFHTFALALIYSHLPPIYPSSNHLLTLF